MSLTVKLSNSWNFVKYCIVSRIKVSGLMTDFFFFYEYVFAEALFIFMSNVLVSWEGIELKSSVQNIYNTGSKMAIFFCLLSLQTHLGFVLFFISSLLLR